MLYKRLLVLKEKPLQHNMFYDYKVELYQLLDNFHCLLLRLLSY